ncbi:MAG: lipoprotein [Nitrospiraceae bacterium]|nr:lipoprotein [Nitrospiraceae bacterium]
MKKALLTICALVLLSGCSVGMAMSGKKEPNLGVVRVGSTRGEVQLHLGNPVTSVTLPEGKRVDVYEYEIGNEPVLEGQ